MAKAFSIRDFMQDARQQDSESDVYERVSVYDIGLNPKNEYTMSEIEKMKDSIYALGGVQQNIVLVRCPDGADHKYLALDGHRRLTASRELVSEGYTEFEYVPAVIKGQIEPDTAEAMLIMMNSTQRNKTDWEKVMEHMRLKEIIPKLKKRQGIDGRTRDIEMDMLGVSRGQISIYNTIGTRLNTALMQLFKNGCIGISLAHSAAQLEPELQQKLADVAIVNDGFDEEDISKLVGSRVIEGQMTLDVKEDVNVPDSGTFNKTQEEPVSTLSGRNKNVPDSGTSDKPGICYTSDKNDVKETIDFIFFMNRFPEDKLDELVDVFRRSENFTIASTAAENIFYKMLPYNNNFVKVTYHSGYQIEYVHTGEIYCIPVYHFWEEFKSRSEFYYSPDDPEPDACDESLAAVDVEEKEDGEQRVKFRGGYEPILIDDLIKTHSTYLKILEEENKSQGLICKYRCLLDALDLLREKLAGRKER